MYRASAESWGDSRFLATTRDSSFAMDTRGKGANPVDTLLAALCGCLGHYVRDFLTREGLPAAGFAVSATGSSAEDDARLAEIAVSVDLGTVRLAEARKAELLAFVRRCKVLRTIEPGCPVEVSIAEHAGGTPSA